MFTMGDERCLIVVGIRHIVCEVLCFSLSFFLFLFLNYLHNSRCFKVDDTRIRNNVFAHFIIYMRNLGSDWLRVASGEVDVEGNMSELKAGRHHMCEVAHDPLFLKIGIA